MLKTKVEPRSGFNMNSPGCPRAAEASAEEQTRGVITKQKKNAVYNLISE